MSSYLTYRSPIRLLKELGLNASEISIETLRSEHEKLVQQLNVSSGDSFHIGNTILTRSQLMELTDTIGATWNLDFHQQIFEHPAILDLLENHAISGNKQDDYRMRSDLGEDREKLGNFISPFLASAIDHLLENTLIESSYSELNKISPLFKFLKERDGVYAFRKLKEWSQSIDARLNDPSALRVEYPADRYIHFCYSPFYNLINTAAKFYPEVPDTVGDALSIFTLSYKRSKNREDNLLKISNQLRELNCSQRSKQMILSNHAHFRSDTKDSGKSNKLGLWITIISVLAVLTVILVFLFFRNSTDADNNDPFGRDNDLQRKNYVSTTPSYSRVLESNFDMDAFKLFHDHTYACVAQKEFLKNEFVWDGVPDIKSALTVSDSANMQPKGKRVTLSNKTNSEILMVVRDDNSLTAHYIRANSNIRLNLDPYSMIFFYSGNNWIDSENIVYEHPFDNGMTSNYSLRYTGRFERTKAIDQRFLKKMYLLERGSNSDLQILKEGGEYVFRGKKFKIPSL